VLLAELAALRRLRAGVIIVHAIAKHAPALEQARETMAAAVARKQLESAEPIPPLAIWIDLIAPTIDEDCRVQEYVGAPIPTKADPDYTEPPETHYVGNGVRYLHASVLSEPEDTPAITGVTFIIAPKTLVTVRYHRVESFDVFAQKLCKSAGEALFPDAVAVGLINTVLNSLARALSKSGENLDRIASAVFRAKGDRSRRNQIYFDTLNALGREEEKISNLRESMVSIERLLLFLSSEGRPANAPKCVQEATKSALRDLLSLEEDAGFKAQKVQFLLDATLGFINLAQNDIIKLFSVLAVIFMPPTVIASIYGMNFKEMPELEWHWGYPFAVVLMITVAIGPYLFFRWKRWL
jgi:magnesium transporter